MARLMRRWLDGWPEVGRIVVGMTRQGFDLQLTQYDQEGWRATFFPEGRTHSMTQAGSGRPMSGHRPRRSRRQRGIVASGAEARDAA
jgi:hypothetical protein